MNIGRVNWVSGVATVVVMAITPGYAQQAKPEQRPMQ
jgi:hypothetical protein